MKKKRRGSGHRNDGDAFTLPLPLPPLPLLPPHHLLYALRLLPLQFGPNPADRLEKFFVHRFQSALAHQFFPMIDKFFVVQTPSSQHDGKVGFHVCSVLHAIWWGLQHRRLFGGIYDEQRRLRGLLNNNSDRIDFVLQHTCPNVVPIRVVRCKLLKWSSFNDVNPCWDF